MEAVITRHRVERIEAFLESPIVKSRLDEDSKISCLTSLYELSVGLSSDAFVLSRLRMNDIYDVDQFLRGINSQLEIGQHYIGCADYLAGYETKVFRQSGFPWVSMRLMAFCFHRVLPKLSWGNRLYSLIMRGRKKRMSKTEILGRLVYAGFDIDETKVKDQMLYYRVVKKREPLQGYVPTYGPLIKLKRVVKGGKLAHIYKLRTMHPYAEFIQEYVYKQNSLDIGGKIKDDFRLSEEGLLFRKYFLDELPMLINLFKGDIKLVGVRPLSEHYLSLYTDSIGTARVKYKPGLLPPFYAEKDKPETLEEVMISEMRYLIQYKKRPLLTDLKYLFMILNNILRKKFRSK